MNERTPALIVSVPAATVAEAKTLVGAAASAGADLAEIRFDRWAPAELARAAELFPAPLPLLATLRSRAEGGSGPDAGAERAPILEQLARLPFRWIDLEAARDSPGLLRLPPPETLGRIVSSHRTGPVTAEEWARSVREEPDPGSIRKVVVRASVVQALTELLPGLPPAGESPLVALTTGPSGPLLRLLARRLGFPVVYAALPDDLRPGASRPPVEASQIPVDRLGPFLRSRDPAPVFGLAGHPVAHSRSPALHSRWMHSTHRTGLYVALDFETEGEFVRALPLLAGWGFRGLNITHPLKPAALAVATGVGAGARTCGVANCLTLRGEEVEAENTDLAAILRRLEELRRDGRWDGKALAVLGTGGAARATLAAARTFGAEIRVYGRRREPTVEVARTFGAEAPAAADARGETLVVQATDVGRGGTGPLELPLSRLVARGTHVLDWVYDPEDPYVRATAVHAGATYEDGRRLLVYQAAASFGVWWGEEPEPEEITRTLAEEGCAA